MTVYFLESMSGYDFEDYCHNLFSFVYKCRVQQTSLSNDEGRDLIMYDGGHKTFIECKNWKTTHVGRPVIQKLHSSMITGNADRGIVVTTGTFTQDAREYVSVNRLNIELIDFNSLQKLAALKGDVLTWERNNTSDYPGTQDYNEALWKQYYAELEWENPNYRSEAHTPTSNSRIDANRTDDEISENEHPNYRSEAHTPTSNSRIDTTRAHNKTLWKQYYAELERDHPNYRSENHNSTSHPWFDKYFRNGVLLSIIIPGGGFLNPTPRTDMSEKTAVVLGILILLTTLILLFMGFSMNKLFYVGAFVVYFSAFLYYFIPFIRKHRN